MTTNTKVAELIAHFAATGIVSTGDRIYFPERKTRELVKAVLTALSQQPSAAGVPDGYVLVPKRFGIPAGAWDAAAFAYGGPATGEGEAFLDCTAWIGEVVGDDGERTHGLHISCDECPDEGSITLAEFPTVPEQRAAPSGGDSGCGACGDACASRDGCRVIAESPPVPAEQQGAGDDHIAILRELLANEFAEQDEGGPQFTTERAALNAAIRALAARQPVGQEPVAWIEARDLERLAESDPEDPYAFDHVYPGPGEWGGRVPLYTAPPAQAVDLLRRAVPFLNDAAAPELLAALVEAVELIETISPIEGDTLRHARAAIAKAVGHNTGGKPRE